MSFDIKNLVHKLRIPTEMYAFIEIEFVGTPDEAVREYRRVSELVKPQPVNQMPRNEFNELFDMVVRGQPIANDPGILDQMSPEQRVCINEAKKSAKRLRDKE